MGREQKSANIDYGKCPVLDFISWEDIISVLPSPIAKKISLLKGVVDYRIFLSPPLTLAHLIASYAPELLEKQEIRVLSVGAETTDTIDEGAWIATLTPLFLGRPATLTLTSVGTRLSPQKTLMGKLFTGEWADGLHKKTLKQFLAETPAINYDAAVFFNPGFEVHRTWLDDGSFGLLASFGMPILATSYSIDDYIADKLVLRAYGYRTTKPQRLNPYRFGDTSCIGTYANWSAILWKIDNACLSTKNMQQWHKKGKSATVGGYPADADQAKTVNIGEQITYITKEGPLVCTALIGNTYITEKNEIAIIGRGMLKTTGVIVKKNVLPPYPGEHATPLEKATWAIEASLLTTEPGNLIGEELNKETIEHHQSPAHNRDIANDKTITVTQSTSRSGHILRKYTIPSEKHLTPSNCTRLLTRIRTDGIKTCNEMYVAGHEQGLMLIGCITTEQNNPMLITSTVKGFASFTVAGMDVTLVDMDRFTDYMTKTAKKPSVGPKKITAVQATGQILEHKGRPYMQTSNPKKLQPTIVADMTKDGTSAMWLISMESKENAPSSAVRKKSQTKQPHHTRKRQPPQKKRN